MATSPLGDFPVDVQGGRAGRPPGELAARLEPVVAHPVTVGSGGSDNRAGDGLGPLDQLGPRRHRQSPASHWCRRSRQGIRRPLPRGSEARRSRSVTGKRIRPPPGRSGRSRGGVLRRRIPRRRNAEFRGERVQGCQVLLVPTASHDRELSTGQVFPCQRPRPQQSVTVLVRPERRNE